MLKRWLLLPLLLLSSFAHAQFFSDRALGVNPFSTAGANTPTPIFLSYAQVRVCQSIDIGIVGTPCPDLATITAVAGGGNLTVVGGSFGQLQTDVVGRFNFGCTVGSYWIQIAATASNTPQLNYAITCPSNASLAGGTVTSVTTSAGSGISIGGTPTTVPTVAITPCGLTGQILQWSSVTGWGCVTGGTGTITAVTVGSGLTGGGTSGSVNVSLGTIAYANFPSQAASTVLMNNGVSSGVPTAVTIPNCNSAAQALNYNSGTGAWICQSITAGAGSPTGTLQGNNGGALGGIPNTVANFSTGYVQLDQVAPAFMGSTNQSWCFVDGRINTSTRACADFAEITNGLRTSLIYNTPEIITVNPLPVNYQIGLRVGAGAVNSTVCDDSGSNTNCTVLDTPLIMTSGSDIWGLFGPVGNGGNYSSGSAIITGSNFPAPVGIPTGGAVVTCNGSGSVTAPFIGVREVVNLETHPGKNPASGFGAYVKKTGCTGVASINITAPTGSLAGSLTPVDFEVGIANTINGDYYLQIPGSGLTCTVGGTVNNNEACKMGIGNSATITTVQSLTTPFESDPKTGNPVDTSNPAIVYGIPRAGGGWATQTFNTQIRDLTVSCPTTGHGVNNPNVLIWNISSEELSGITSETMLYGDCGGYTGIAGTFIYNGAWAPNSAWDNITFVNGPGAATNSPFSCIIMDGRYTTPPTGGASGSSRQLSNMSCNLRGGDTTDVGMQFSGARDRSHMSNMHFEILNSNDDIYVTNGARLELDGIEALGGIVLHIDATAGAVTAKGICASGFHSTTQDRCDTTAIAIQDDGDTSGNMPLLGYQSFYQSVAATSYLAGSTNFGGTVTGVMQTGFPHGTDTGTSGNNYVVANLSPPMKSYVTGNIGCFTPIHNNSTGAPTVNFNGLGTVTIRKPGGALAAVNEILTTRDACMWYDAAGNNFTLMGAAQAVTGTGSAVQSNSPSFVTGITTPKVALTGGPWIDSGTPTVFSGFGTGASITANSGTSTFKINVGTGGTATTGTIGFPVTATNGWHVWCDDITTQSATVFYTHQTAGASATTASIANFNTAGAQAAWVASDILVCSAMAY